MPHAEIKNTSEEKTPGLGWGSPMSGAARMCCPRTACNSTETSPTGCGREQTHVLSTSLTPERWLFSSYTDSTLKEKQAQLGMSMAQKN